MIGPALVVLTALGLAALPAWVFWQNRRQFLPPPSVPTDGNTTPPRVSLLIPARNEQRSIGECLAAARASRDVLLEIIVLDDHSTDATARIVAEHAALDDRVRLISAPPLPALWCGKQHACHVLAKNAGAPWLAFLDADVRLAPDALVRLVAFAEASRADLVSGFPHQLTESWLERLLIPLIHWLLLGFLPLDRMRTNGQPAYAAGCGQLFLARRAAYDRAGGHAAIRASLHDGLTLPRAFRRAGCRTDLCDVTDLAACRMYRSAGEVWRGLAKNATEGLASPGLIVPVTLLLGLGQVGPPVLLVTGLWQGWPVWLVVLAAVGCAAVWVPRLAAAAWFRHSWLGAVLHPVGIAILLAIQWYALGRKLLGLPSTWKDRRYGADVGDGGPMGTAAGVTEATDAAVHRADPRPPLVSPEPRREAVRRTSPREVYTEVTPP